MSQEKLFSIHVIIMKSTTHQKFQILIIFYERINGDKNNGSFCAEHLKQNWRNLPSGDHGEICCGWKGVRDFFDDAVEISFKTKIQMTFCTIRS